MKKDLSNLIDFIKYPIITEKSTNLLEQNQYTFLVDKQITKPEIKKAIEFLFQINVKKVNLQNLSLKEKRVGLKKGYKSRYKKAMVHIVKNQKIDIFNV